MIYGCVSAPKIHALEHLLNIGNLDRHLKFTDNFAFMDDLQPERSGGILQALQENNGLFGVVADVLDNGSARWRRACDRAGAGMRGVVHAAEVVDGDVRVDLRGREARVAEKFLHGAQIGPGVEQMRGERVA